MPEDSNIIKRSSLNALMAALSPVKEEAPRSYTAEIRRIDQDGVAWCRIFDTDVDETPVENVTMTVKPGDIVGITIEDGVATANPSSESKLVSSSYMEAVMRGIAGDTSALEDYGYMDPLSVYDSTGNADMVFNSVTAISGNFQYLTAETARVGELVAGKVSTNYLRANYLDADYINTNYLTAQQIRTDYLDADYINANYLTSDYIQTNYLTAQQIRTDYLTAQQIQTDYLTAQQIRTDYMTANEIRANYLTANQIRTDYLDAEAIEAGYAHIDLENVNNSWIENGVIKNAAISDAQILGVSANKLTAGTIDASKINVANLRAKNLVVEKLNGQPVLGGYELVNPNGSGYSSKNPKSEGWYEYSNGTWTASTDTAVDSSKVYYKDAEQVSLYDQDYIDGLEHGLNQRIDGAVETFTGTAVPTMVNYPVSDWSDSEYQSHIGDIYYVVNQAAPEDGYCYRFAYDNTSKQYQWVLIKDSDVTKALSDISDLQTFESETNSWIEETDEGLRTIRQNHTSLSGVVDKTVKTSVQLWFTKADTTAPAAPTSKVTSTSTGGNAWTTAVPAWNASYPNYYYCWQYELVDGSYTWSAVVKDIAMGESQGTSRSAQSTANANIKSSTMLWFSKADSTTPAKPTSQVTSTSTDGNAWRLVVPTYNASYPYYFYCYQQQRGDGTYQWTDVVYDRATTESQSTARAASSSLANYITSNDAALQSLQDQVDGAVDIWYGTADPTSSTKPWDSGDADSIHEGDMYYNTTSGHVFRYVKNGSAYSWTQLPDSDAAAALAAAQDAQATADGKRRVFTAQPTPPYDVGDLWVRGTEVRYANKKRESGSYTASEWSLTSTDDTMAKANIKSSVMLWFSKTNSTAPSKPTSQVTSTGTGGNAWTTVVPTWNATYPHYFYCYQQQKGDGTWQWTDVVYDRATSEAQQKAAAALPASTFTTFQSTTFKELVDEVDEQSSTITTMSERIDNIQVGGRNLLKERVEDYKQTVYGLTFDYNASTHILHISGTNTKTDSVWVVSNPVSKAFTTSLVPGEEYTLTAYDLGGFFDSVLYAQLNTYVSSGSQVGDWSVGKERHNPSHTNTVRATHDDHNRWANLFIGIQPSIRTLDVYVQFKFEKGNMATDWSPSPETMEGKVTTVSQTVNSVKQTADTNSASIRQVTERVENLQVGGRNLLFLTKGFATKDGSISGGYLSAANASLTAEIYNGLYVRSLDLTASDAASYKEFSVYWNVLTTKQDETYVFSFYAKGDGYLRTYFFPMPTGGTNIEYVTSQGASGNAHDGGCDHVLSSNWERYWVKWTVPGTVHGSRHVLIRQYKNTSASVCGLMFEVSDAASNWSPAPEDTDSQITTLTTKTSEITQTLDGVKTVIGYSESSSGQGSSTLVQKVNQIDETVDGHTQTIRSAVYSGMTGVDILTSAAKNINGWTINAPTGANYTKSAYGTDGTTVTFSAVGGYENLYSPNISVEAGKSYTVSFDYTVGKAFTPTSNQGGYGLGVYDGSGYPGSAYDTSNTKFIAKSYICDEKTTIKQVSTVTFTARSNTVVLMFNGGNIVDGQTGLTFSFDNLRMVESVGSALSMLSEDYATFKSTVNEFEATVGTTYATKGELETEAKQRKAGFGVCTTAAATAAKAVTVSNFSLYTGATVTVRFDSGNTAASPTLNVSGTGAKPIVVNGTASPTADQCKWSAYATCMFTYDGGRWRLVGTDEDTNRIITAETSIKSNAEAISLRATKSEAYQSAQPNLSPMFSSHNEDGTYPDGGVGGFWQPSNDKYYNRSYFTALEDGWMHVEAANNAQKEFVPARVDGLKANDHVTLLVEWRNATWTGNGAAFYSRNYPNNVQLPANWTAPVNSASGEARTSYAVSSADGAQAWNGLIDWTFTAASSSTWTGDIRISFYKEIYDSNAKAYIQYAGPYKPYSGSQLYASQSELKVTADGISSTVSKIGGVKQLTSTTGSGWSLASIKAYALETATTNFNVSSTSDVRVGDMVYIKGYDNTRKCDVYIKGIVTAVNSATSVTISGRGYEDKIPVDSAISSINQSAEAIRIEAKRVEIDGSTVFRNSSTSTTTLSDYVGGVAQDKADAVKIGGRNYAITMCRDVSQTTNGVTVKQIGPSTIRLNGTTTALSSTANIVFRTPILKPGKYSLWLTNPGSGSGLVWFRLGVGSGNTHVYSSQGAFTKDNPYVFEVTSENYYAFYPVIANSTTFTNFETSFMLEAGNRPSSWTPAPEELQAPNLSPFFSFEPYNTVAGQGAQYWNSITDASHFTPMGDGWVKHVTRDNTSGTAVLYDQHRPKSMGSLDPEATYTLMVEFRNVSKTGNVYLRCPDSGQSGTAAISLNGVPNTSIDLAIANGIYYKVFKTAASTATNYSVFFGLCTRVDAGVKATYEMRLSIYEGVYYGPYQPYTGHAVTQEQRIYYRSNSTSAPTAPTTFVTANGTANTTWTTKRMPYDSTYKYLYTTMQRKYADGNTSCGPVLLDDTTTVIDGGNIITNTITANKLDADSINASKMLGVGSLADAAKKALDNSEIVIGGRNLFLNSGTPASWPRYITNEYEIARVYLSENLVKGDEYTIQVWGTVSRSDKTGAFHVYWGGGGVSLGVLTPNSARDYWVLTFTAPNSSNTQTSNAWLVLWNTPPQGASGTTYSATITKVKIEKGNKATDWSEAPEDTVGFKYLSSNCTNDMATVKSWAVEGKDAGNWTVSSTAGVHVGDTVYIKTVPSDNYNNPVYVILTVTSISSATVLKGISHGYLDTASTVSKNVVTTAIDFNDYKTSGMFYVKVSSNTNAPTTGHGLLEVNFDVGTPYQIWQPDSSSLEYYKRWYSSSTWSAWKKLDPNGAYNLASTANNKANAWRGTESGDMGAAAKTIACAGFTTDHLVQGTTVTAYCANSQGNAGTITLNVQGTGAYNVWVGNAVTSDTNRLLWLYGCTITFVFVGSASSGYWKIVDNPPAYYGATCTVAEGTASKTTVIDNAILYKGATLSVPMSNTNTASAMTLAVLNSSGTSIGANTVYHGASTNVPTKANGMAWPAGEAVIFTYDGKFWRTGNQTFVDGGHVVTGTISADRIQVSDIKIGDLNGYSALSTRVSSGESALTKVNYYNRYALAHQSTTLNTSKPWYKFASVNITTQNTVRVIKFDVMINGYGVAKYGTLVAHIRAGANIGSVEYHDFVWLDRNSAIFPAKFVMAYKLTSGTSLACELWCKLDEQSWHGFRFNQIYENGTEASPFWTLYQTSTNGSEAAITSGYTQQASVDASTAFLTRIDENGIRVHPASTENNRVEIKAAGMQVYKGGYLKANYADTITLYGGSNASGANPSVSLSSTDFKMLDSGGVQRIALNSTDGAIIGKPTQGHTQITDAGAYFYDTNNKKRSDITASGLQVYDTDGATSVASFGASARIGKTSAPHITVDSEKLDLNDSSATPILRFQKDSSNKYGMISFTPVANATTVYDSATTYISGGTTSTGGDIHITTLNSARDNSASIVMNAPTSSKSFVVVSADNIHLTGSITLSAALPVAQGGTGVTALKNNTSVGALGWTSATNDVMPITSNTLAYWNGRYSGTSSNLAYCNKGAFGTAATNNTGDFYTSATSRTANTVLAAPNGSAGAATFRALVAADIPSLSTDKLTSGTLSRARGGTGMTAIATTNFSNSGQSVANNTATDITFNSQAYFNFPSTGIFLMTCSVTFLSNATGLRAVCVNNTSKNVGLNYTDLNACSSPAVNGEPTKFVWTSLVNITDATQKWYMSVKHTAGAALTVRAYVRVVKIFAS